MSAGWARRLRSQATLLAWALCACGALAGEVGPSLASRSQANQTWNRIAAAGRSGCLLQPLAKEPRAQPQALACRNQAALLSKDGSRCYTPCAAISEGHREPSALESKATPLACFPRCPPRDGAPSVFQKATKTGAFFCYWCPRDRLGRPTAFDPKSSRCYAPCPRGYAQQPGTALCAKPCPAAYPTAAGAKRCRARWGSTTARQYTRLEAVPATSRNILGPPFNATVIDRSSLPKYWDPAACPAGAMRIAGVAGAKRSCFQPCAKGRTAVLANRSSDWATQGSGSGGRAGASMLPPQAPAVVCSKAACPAGFTRCAGAGRAPDVCAGPYASLYERLGEEPCALVPPSLPGLGTYTCAALAAELAADGSVAGAETDPEPWRFPSGAGRAQERAYLRAGVAVNFSAEGAVLAHKLGTYRSEEDRDWARIYSPRHTLGPLRLPHNRVQLSLGDADVAPDGTFALTPAQAGILRLSAQAVASHILVTVGFPWTSASRAMIGGGFADPAWRPYFRRVFATAAAALAGADTGGKPIWVEVFGEPDMGLWSWVYGGDRRRVFEAALMAHDAFRAQDPGVVLGGMGFACPEQGFICLPGYITDFLGFYAAHRMRFDFWSFHAYLGWTDASDPSAYPPPPGPLNLGSRAAAFRALLSAAGVPAAAPVLCTEYGWQDGDGSASWGFGDPAKSARGAMTDHRSAARALQAIDIAARDPGLAAAFWAQGVGSAYAQPEGQLYGYAYNPLVVYFEGQWRYKAGYYAFWLYGRLAGRPAVAATSRNPRVGVVATAAGVAIYNRSPLAQQVGLAAVGRALSAPATLYLIDGATYRPERGGLLAVVSGPTEATPPVVAGVATLGQALDRVATLGPEATACILFAD